MCGILGQFSLNNNLIPKEQFQNILALSKSRGPDQTCVEIVPKRVQFGFNRLSVLDLSNKGSQPIWSPSGRYLIAFNGEIYNHQSLRLELGGIEKQIKSHGDTATLAYCIDANGVINTIKKLEGMFAIAVWDKLKDCIFLSRDFAGIKPLFYGWDGFNLVFASQYNQISNYPHYRNEKINHSVLKLYLYQHFIPPPFGILENTFAVFPGEIIMINKHGELEKINHWSFPDFDDTITNEQDVQDMIENEIRISVREQLNSDVPLGSFLSGGVDSPLISSYMNNYLSDRINTFSIGSDSIIHDESYLSKMYSKELKSKHYQMQMTAENSIEYLDKALISVGEPFGDHSIIPSWKLSNMASSKVTVLLSGDGGDEIFFGYERFRSIAKNYWLWNYPFFFRYLVRGIDRLVSNEKYINECILSSTPGEAHFGLHSHQSKNLINELIPSLSTVTFPDIFNLYKYTKPDSVNKLFHIMRRVEFYGMLQKTLAKVDRASMANSIEVRVPFLKKKIIEQVIKTGIQVHQPMTTRKKILNNLLQKSYGNIKSESSKKGFSVPISEWIRTSYKELFYEKLLDRNFCQSFGINMKKIEQILDQHINGKIDLKAPLFTLYSLSIWNAARK